MKPAMRKKKSKNRDISEADMFSEPLSVLLLRWYDGHKRDLPWRGSSPRDPYRVWVSEIMLQQTRVEAVKEYYANWMERFPDVASLAAAEEDMVLKQWQGLGYYSRARNLHTAAREIMETYGGRIPETREEIRKLKGIGDYTAGAILSFAYGKREVAVDGNVLRIFARLFAIEGNILSSAVKNKIARLAADCQDPVRPGDFNEALMDLGSAVCVPGIPRCGECPLISVCKAKEAGRETELPLRVTKKDIPEEEITVCIVRLPDHGGAAGEGGAFYYLLHRRQAKGLLAGMWEFPSGSGAGGYEALQNRLADQGIDCRWSARPVWRLRHVFSHKIWVMAVYEGLARSGRPEIRAEDRIWVKAEDLGNYTLAGPHNKILRKIILT